MVHKQSIFHEPALKNIAFLQLLVLYFIAALKQIMNEVLLKQRKLKGKEVFEYTATRLRQLGRKVKKLKTLERLQVLSE